MFFDAVKNSKNAAETFFDLIEDSGEIRPSYNALSKTIKKSLNDKLKENFYSISEEIYNDLMVSMSLKLTLSCCLNWNVIISSLILKYVLSLNKWTIWTDSSILAT